MKLTLPQQDIYFEQLLYPIEPIYNIGAKIEIKGEIDIEFLKKAYLTLINQHDVFRSVLIKNDDNIEFEILSEHRSELEFIDFSFSNHPMEEATQYMQKGFIKPFDLFNGKLLHQFTLIRVKEDFHYLFSVYHHIITDGWGTSIMFNRLVQNYNDLIESGNINTEYNFKYNDFVEDDQEYQNSDYFTTDKKYWTNKFQALPENLFSKLDNSIHINKSNRKELIIKRELYDKLNELATSYKSSLFHLLLAVFFFYFGRKHQNKDFAIGLPVLNRNSSRFKKTVGLFMGVSPLRIQLDFDFTFENLIVEIKNQLRTDYRHQRFPLGKLIQELQIFNQKERLFNIILSYEKHNYSNNFRGTQTRIIPLTHQSERVALAIYVREFSEKENVKIDFDYNLNYFDQLSISSILIHFEKIINAILISPKIKLKELCYLTEKERKLLLLEFNETKTEYPKDKTIIDLFEEQVLKTPEKIAIKDDTHDYSYYDLNLFSNKIAEYLITQLGDFDKSPIAVLVGRSAKMILVLLGILKSGRSYIPLDPAFPKDRLKYIIDNSQTKVIIGEKDFLFEELEDVTFLDLKSIIAEINKYKGIISTNISPQNIAYIIYTSGSTGNPKGVEVGHQSLLNFLTSIQHKPGICSTDTLFSVTTYSFDISMLEFFAPLISGATLYIAVQDILSDPNLIIKKIEEVQTSVIQATPSFYQMLFNSGWKGNKKLKVLCGGDLLSETLADKLLTNSREVWNMYGPTETTVWSSIKKITNFKDNSNIGKPINNTQFYILDEFLNPMPIATTGAIYIGGDGLAKGYYKNEPLTKQKFIKNPFIDNGYIYETGDVGKWNMKGEIEFLGRNDNQVKIRGYRIELGDIESNLNQIDGIKDSVVVAKKSKQNEGFLVAYVLSSGGILNTEKIISELKMNLPEYMIPNTIITLDKFPLNSNQKVDRKYLSQKNIYQFSNNYKTHSSSLEKQLINFWGEALNCNHPIGIRDNFFSLGGHSLSAVKLMGLMSKFLSFDLSLKVIFDYPTVESLAAHIEKLTPNKTIVNIPLSEPKDFYELTPSQYNIWLASQQGNYSIAYNMSAAYSFEGAIVLDRLVKAINGVINKYEILRTNFIEVNGIPYQKINSFEKERFTISIIELANNKVKEAINQLISKEFNLENELILRIQLLKLETNECILLFSTHHILMDGMSFEIFIKEFIRNYNEDNNFDLSTGNILQFKDYSEWFNRTLSENSSKNELFWGNYLRNYQQKNIFERDYSNIQNHQSVSKHLFELSSDATLGINKIAIENNLTVYTVLAAALNVLIYKFSKHEDICIGTVTSGRNLPELNTQIGMFAKTIILRTKIYSEYTFLEICNMAQNNLLEISANEDVPFDKFPQSFFDVMFVYHPPDFSIEIIDELKGIKLKNYPIDNKYSRLPLVFNLMKIENQLQGIIDYNCDLFEENSIKIIALKYSKLINELIKNTQQNIDLIDIKLEFEKSTTIDFDFNF